jgi:NADH-quinone oxidoreductase subunit L
MDLTPFIQVFIAVPLLGLLSCFFVPSKNEVAVSYVAIATTALQFTLFLPFVIYWLIQGAPTLNLQEFALFESQDYVFLIDFFFDKITATYLFVGSLLSFLVIIFSRYYLHREPHYKYFFCSILLLDVGYNLTIFSGNFETLFAGWEVVGLSSFLLIAFYRDRYLPVRNAVKVFSIYRIGDVGILLAMWASHHLWHENITFLKLENAELVHHHLEGHSGIGIFISLMILLAAAAKSAQFPFSSWLPRAMEGPTPSSAIFYGSISVHFGVFLLLRTYPFWENQIIVKAIIISIGLITAFAGALLSRVQSSIKAQIAYGSIAQIGIMFIEVVLGFHALVLVHFAGNAFLRTYQLLVSPSVVSYLIREQFYNYHARPQTLEDSLPKRLEYSIYILCLKEWNLDAFMNKYIFGPIKRGGHKLNFLHFNNLFILFIPTFLLGVFLNYNDSVPADIKSYLPPIFTAIGLLMVMKAFSERISPHLAWSLVLLNQFWTALAITYNEHFDFSHTILFFSGSIPAAILGYICLEYLRRREPNYFSLNQYYGHQYEYKTLSFVFLLAALGLMGFPISPTFIGEDLIISHIKESDFALAIFTSLSYVISGIALIRIYARLFLGPHVKTYHPVPLKNS